MKKLLTVLCFSFSSLALAGGMEGGGGVGVRCGTHLELLEVHEARLANVKLLHKPVSETAAINLTAKLVGVATWQPVFDSQEEYIELGKNLIVEPMFRGEEFFAGFTEDGNVITGKVAYVDSLQLSEDYGNYQLQDGCQLEQIAYFEDGATPILKIVKTSWNELDWMSKSILIAHEQFYAVDRKLGSIKDLAKVVVMKNSEWTRKYLIKLFSVQGVTAQASGLPHNGHYITCSSSPTGASSLNELTSFSAYQTPKGLKVIFEDLLGRGEFYQVLASYKHLKADDLLLNSTSVAKENSDLVFVDSERDSQLKVEITKHDRGLSLRVFAITKNRLEQVGKDQDLFCTQN